MVTAEQGLSIDLALSKGGFHLSISEAVQPGVTGLTGPSGAGKSTLLRLLAGLEPQATGCLRYAGRTFSDSKAGVFVPPERRRLSYVPQHSCLFPHLKVAAQLEAGRYTIAEQQRSQIIEMLGLAALLNAPAQTLSGGERQRVALARGLCAGPQLLLLDEPLSAVDPGRRYQIWGDLKGWLAQRDVTTLWVSHDAVELQVCTQHVLLMDAGAIVDRGNPAQVLSTASLGSENDQQPGFDNVFEAMVSAAGGGETSLALGSGGEGPVLSVGRNAVPASGPALLVVPARSVILTTLAPGQTSARNVLQATVVEISGANDPAMVVAESCLGRHRFRVEVTRAAVGDLQLSIGSTVFALIKSTACRVLPA